MNIVVNNCFPVELFPCFIKSSKVLLPIDMFGVLEDSRYDRSQYVFLDIIMRRFNFPFSPCMFGNKIKILLYKNNKKCRSYVTEELIEPDVSHGNIKFIQHMLESRNIIDTYNNIIYMIIKKVFRLHKNNFAIYGRDHIGNIGYLSFTDSKSPMFHSVL